MRSRIPSLVVVTLIVVYVVVFSAIAIRQHDAFLTHKEDLGQIDQAVWNSLHGRWLVETDEDHQSTRLTDHAEPSLILSSLVFLLWDDVRALLIWQALVLSLGAWAIFLLARDVLGDAWFAALFALIYLLFPALDAAHLVEFHAAPLAAAPIAFALLFLERRQWRRFVVATLLVIAVKEEMALVGVMLGVAGLRIALRDFRVAAQAFTLCSRESVTGAPPERAPHARPEAGQGAGRPGTGHPPAPSPDDDATVTRREERALSRLTPSLARSVLLPSAFVLLTSLIWFVLATFVIIPHFGAAKYGSGDSIYFQRFGDLGATPAAVVRTLFTNPLLILRTLSEPARLGYVGGLLASVGFLALLSPGALLIGAPLLMANLLSNFPAQYSGDFHYSAPLAPFFVAAAVYGLRRLWRWAPSPWLSGGERPAPCERASARPARGRSQGIAAHAPMQKAMGLLPGVLIAGVLVSIFLNHRVRGYSPLSENFYWPDITPHDQHFDRFASQIPRDARLSATPPLFPHLSHREFMYVFPVVADADYVLLDAAAATDMHPNDFRNAVNALLTGGQFGVLSSADGYILLKRGAAAGDVPDSFYDFVRAPAARPQVPVDVVFGDAVRLLGYDLLPEPRWHTMRVRYYWQALRPLDGPPDGDLRLYPFYHDASGTLIEDSTQRPLVAATWYPLSRWRVGEIIQSETLPWDVGDSFMLAAGVMHGNDFDRKGRRLATPSGDTQVELGSFEWQGKMVVRR